MMTIWGRPIMVDLEQVLEDISRESIRLGIQPISRTQRSARDIFITCPNVEGHGGVMERTPSCSVSKDYGMVHCFGCGYSDSLPGMIDKIFGFQNKIAGYRWILQRYSIPERGYRPLIKLEKIPRGPEQFFLPDDILDQFSFDHPYMFKRGLSGDIVDLFDLGYDKQTDSITIPMRDHKDRLLFIKKRPIKRTKFHKYHIDEGVDKKDLVFGLNIIKKYIERVKMIYLCEGEFDVMSCYVAEKWGAGTQGDRLFPEQVKQLVRVARGIPITLLYDNDNAGRKARERSVDMLRPYFPLYEPVYPNKVGIDGKPKYKDPNDLLRANLLGDLEIRKII